MLAATSLLALLLVASPARDAGDYARCAEESRAAWEQATDDRTAASHLDELVYCLLRSGTQDDDEVLVLAERALTLRERLHGSAQPENGLALRNLGRALWQKGRPDDALAAYTRARDAQAALGSTHPEHGRNLRGQANLLRTLDRADEAEASYREAIGIFAEVGEAEEEAITRNSFGRLLRATGRLDDAEAQTRRAIALQTEVDPDHPRRGVFAANLGQLLRTKGDLDEARTWFQTALTFARDLPDAHSRKGYTHRDLGRVLYELGEFEASLDPLRAAARLLGALEEHASAGIGAQQLLGDALTELHRFEDAAPVLRDALTARARLHGPESTQVATVEQLLGKLHRTLGDQAQALVHYSRALELRKAHYGDAHVRVAETLLNLADVQAYLGHPEEASALVQEALGTGKLRGETWAFAAVNLAHYRLAVDDLEMVRGLVDQARPIFLESHGEESRPVAALESVEGQLADREGDTLRAVDHFRRSWEILRAVQGVDHPMTAVALEDLATARWRAGRPEEALDAALAAEATSRAYLDLAAGALPDRQALRARPQFHAGLDVALTVAAASDDPAFRVRAYAALVGSRALVLDALGARRSELRTPHDATTRREVEALRDARRRLARAVAGNHPDPARIARLRQEKEAQELRVAERVDLPRRADPSVEQLRAALPPDAALVSWVRVAVAGEEPVYQAWVLTAVDLAVVSLGSEAALRDAVAAWRAEVVAGFLGGPETLASYREAGDALRRRLWDPVAGHLPGIRRVFLVPDGMVHTVALTTLPVEGDRFLLETGPRMHRLGAERDLVRDAPAASGHALLAVGDPAFAPDDAAPTACADLASLRFEPLPATGDELSAVTAAWSGPSTTLTGTEATETAVKRALPGHAVVHLATHGFFLDGSCARPSPGTRGIGTVVRRRARPAATVETPLLRAGLALAGANRRDDGTGGDGILLAEEILDLDLTAADWVVLSACDTGLGDLEAGEGVVGLQRAFTLAGARTLIMSLWSVQDEATGEWMRELYDARWREGRSTADAMGEASRRVLTRRRAEGRSQHPFFWGSFVASGDWR